MNKRYIALKDYTDTVYGVEYGVPYPIIGITNCCYVIKNNNGTIIEVEIERCVELNTLTPKCIEKEIDTTIVTKQTQRFV